MVDSGASGHYSMEERVDSFKKYYARQNKRALFGFYVGGEYPMFQYEASRVLPEDRPLTPEDFDIDSYLDDCDRLFDLHESCGGDFVWSASPFWGVPWLEAALGCPIYAKHSTGALHSEPPANFTRADSIPDFDEASPWVRKTKDFITAMAKRSGGRWPIGTTRMRGISDLLSALYGGENFIYAIMENPDEVMRVCEKLTDFWIKFGKMQLEAIPPFHGGVGSYFYNMWAPEGTVWLQEDAVALLSPRLYDEFIKLFDERIVKAFSHCIIHQHSTGFVPTKEYIDMGMTALELHVDEAGPKVEELLDRYRRILNEKPLLIWGKISKEEFRKILTELPCSGLAVNIMIPVPEEAGGYIEVANSL